LRRLLYSDILIRFCERIPSAWVVIYAIDQGTVSATQVVFPLTQTGRAQLPDTAAGQNMPATPPGGNRLALTM
jgi:hypothetical protein